LRPAGVKEGRFSAIEKGWMRMAITRDLTDRRWITIKGALFLLLGVLSAVLLLLQRPTAKVILLLLVTTWSFCRFYYFAFYVMQHYVDADYKYSGLLSLAHYFIKKKA
jgi:steroid 5-alpha reductase family enzyme